MTMLDRMRRHRNWLKWSLGLVCLAFVIFYIPDFLRGNGAGAATSDTIAIVEGQEITADEFRRTYQAQLQAYRSAYGGNMSESLLKQLGVDQQILQQLVDERAALAEAERLGIDVSDAEVVKRITAIPAFQENGVFIGEARYRQLLASQRTPVSPGEFEENVRRSLVVEKLRASLTDWVSVDDKELEQEYRLRNEKVKLAVVSIKADSLIPDVKVNDAELSTYFDGHKGDFRVPEKRKIRYLLVDVDALRAKLVIPQSDIERAYNDSIEQYTTPEEVRASHILLKTEGKDEAAVKAKAEDILKQVKGGGDFAALAKKYSEDEASAKNGGDLDFFGRGRMVPAFDTAAFAMEPGQISDLVKTEFGYHIIKLVDKKPGAVKTLADVRASLVDQLSLERAQAQAGDLGDKLAKDINKASDLDTAARTAGFKVEESGFFSRTEPIMSLGGAPEVSVRAFDLEQGQVSTPIRSPRGIVFIALAGKQDSYEPKFDEAKDRVREELVRTRARDLARQKIADLAGKLKAGDFEKAAKAAGADSTTTDFIARGASIPNLGSAPEVLDAAFKMTPGSVSEPITTDAGTAIIKLVEKEDVTSSDFATNKDSFREQLVNDRRGRFYGSYMMKAKMRMKIEVNREVLQRVIG